MSSHAQIQIASQRQDAARMKVTHVAIAWFAIMTVAANCAVVVIDKLVITTEKVGDTEMFVADGKLTTLPVVDGFSAIETNDIKSHKKIVTLKSGSKSLVIPMPDKPSDTAQKIIDQLQVDRKKRLEARERKKRDVKRARVEMKKKARP